MNAEFPGFLGRKIDNQNPVRPRFAGVAGKTLGAVGEKRIVVAEKYYGNIRAGSYSSNEREHVGEGR